MSEARKVTARKITIAATAAPAVETAKRNTRAAVAIETAKRNLWDAAAHYTSARQALGSAIAAARKAGIADDDIRDICVAAALGKDLGYDAPKALACIKLKGVNSKDDDDKKRSLREEQAYANARQLWSRAKADNASPAEKAAKAEAGKAKRAARAPSPEMVPRAQTIAASPDVQAREAQSLSSAEHAARVREAVTGFRSQLTHLHNACARFNTTARDAYAGTMRELAALADAYRFIEDAESAKRTKD